VPDLKDILNDNDDLQNDDLLKYMQGNLSKDEQHKVEQQMADSDFVSDAVEGLESMKNKKSIEEYVDELNRQLHKQIETKKKRREKRKLKEYPWVTIAVIIVLGLCLLAYIVIRAYQKNKNVGSKPVSGYYINPGKASGSAFHVGETV
jgi:hypothetical protein